MFVFFFTREINWQQKITIWMNLEQCLINGKLERRLNNRCDISCNLELLRFYSQVSPPVILHFLVSFLSRIWSNWRHPLVDKVLNSHHLLTYLKCEERLYFYHLSYKGAIFLNNLSDAVCFFLVDWTNSSSQL